METESSDSHRPSPLGPQWRRRRQGWPPTISRGQRLGKDCRRPERGKAEIQGHFLQVVARKLVLVGLLVGTLETGGEVSQGRPSVSKRAGRGVRKHQQRVWASG